MNHKTFSLPEGVIHYWISETNPEKPWLVFLPGLSADHTLFEKQIAYFKNNYNCFVWDAPAHGHSRPFTLTSSLKDIAEYLHCILDAEHIISPVFIGQSFGGYITQQYMTCHPDKITAFVSVDSCPLSRKYYSGWELALLKRTKWMYRSIPWKLLLKWGIWGTSTTNYGRKLMEKTWSVYNKIEFCNLADYGYRILAEAVEARESYPINVPTLLLCGEKDAAGSAKRYNKAWTKQDGHPLILLEGAGHNSNTDVPNEVNRIIEDFIISL